MHTLSKLVVIVVMLRGRHRGLPVALDRAVLMPSEFLETRLVENSDAQEKGVQHDGEHGDVPGPLRRGADELEARMRMRTRTISLVVEERRDAALEKAKEKDRDREVGVLVRPWVADDIAEGSRGSSVEGGESSVRAG